jgi:PAS domain S-box-containing protein
MRFAVEQLQVVFDSLDYQVSVYDREWQFVYLNRLAADRLGRPVEALLGTSVWALLPETIGSQFHHDLHRAAATGTVVHGARGSVPFDPSAEMHVYPCADGILLLAREETPDRVVVEALEERDALLRLAQSSGGIGIFDWDLAAATVRGSAEFFGMLGLPSETGTITLDDWRWFLHPLDIDRMTAHAARALEAREPAAADYRIVTRDGRTRWLHYAGQLHTSKTGDLRMLGTVTDITARKNAEEELLRSDERYRAFVATSSEAIWRCELKDPVPVSWPPQRQVDAFFESGYLAECNDAMAHMYGFSGAQDLVGARLSDLLPPDVPANRAHLLRFVESGYRLTGQESHEFDRHGRPRVFRNSLIGIVEDDRMVRAWGTQADITDLQVAQERERFLATASAALASSLDYRETLATVTQLALSFLADACAVDIFADDGTIERLAIAHHDGDELGALLAAEPTAAPRLDGLLAEVRRTHRAVLIAPPLSAEHAAALESLGAAAPASAIVAPFVIRHRVLGAITLALSGSPRAYEDSDLRVAEDLAHRAAIAIDNARLYEEAQAANRAKDDFLARLSHELRTPLNAVLGWTLMLRGTTDAARIERGLTVIDRNGRALTRIIEDLLDFSRNVRSGMRLEPTAIDLCDVAREAVASIEPVALQKEVSLALDLGGPCMVAGDAARLQQVAWNLLANAIKFTPPGGAVRVGVCAAEQGVELRVSDTGEGIRPDLLDAIFDPFRQGEAHGTPGLGLGLAIVRQIVEAHGGTVEAANANPSPGATFTVRLPSVGV